VYRARGELPRASEIETDLRGELEQIRARIDADRPEPVTVELDAETEAASGHGIRSGPRHAEQLSAPPASTTPRRRDG
jgi:hypothetical protein